MGTGIVPVDLSELAPALVNSCDADGKLQTPLLGQRGDESFRSIDELLSKSRDDSPRAAGLEAPCVTCRRRSLPWPS